MGQSGSKEGGSSLSNSPADAAEPICDSVYEFRKPSSGPVEMEIVFIHGLQLGDYKQAFWKTWIAGDSDQDGKEVNIWPSTWLSEDFPQARILSLSYDSSAVRTSTRGRMDGYILGESLVQELVEFAAVGRRPNCPVVFVCHSLGGLIVKEIIIKAKVKHGNDPKYVTFLQNIRGFHFYATPHDGSKLADLASYLPKTGDMVKLLQVINDNLGRLNADFERIEREDFAGKWQFAVVAETHETKFHGFCAKVVDEASARHGYRRFYAASADHFGVCKPNDKVSMTYQFLTRFITDVVTPEQIDSIPADQRQMLQMERRSQDCDLT